MQHLHSENLVNYIIKSTVATYELQAESNNTQNATVLRYGDRVLDWILFH